ncbi:DUF1648 domain-containing protein [Serinibacter salmoneus]|uniref:Uncharacterized protein DUF1648 n=1 Tax=Serinibacter salmoneus TaxID=556530 RepID=A0A2A9D0F5_9MICO|nr:DUF1648 domain-containing protein [Serinibacter salmoneus]PFG19422.1 uncharacterized protein DUF1648 [Serinibacter salmoneus]
MTTRPTVRIAATGVLLVAVATGVTVALLGAWSSALPDPVATHWGTGGSADGFASVGAMVWAVVITGVLGLALAVWSALTSTPSLARTLLATTVGTVAFIDALLLASIAAQRGLTEATGVAFSGWWFVIAAAAALALAALAALLVPTWRAPWQAAGVRAEAMPLAAGENVVWAVPATSGSAGSVAAILGVALVLIVALVSRMWWLLALAAVLALVMAALLSIRVAVGPGGLTVTGRLGWPRVHIPAEEITAVATEQVSAFRQFGGWGYRVGIAGSLKGARGFVLHSGEGIVVTTRSGRREVVVVNGAGQGAALLEAYRERAAAR